MVKQHFYILRGLPGSGRGDKAKNMVEDNPWLVRVSREDIAMQLYGFYHPMDLDRFMTDNVSLIQQAQIDTALKAGLSVVDDDINVDAESIKKLYILANRYGVTPEIIDFNLHFEKCIKVDRYSKPSYGETYIRTLVKKFVDNGNLRTVPKNDPSEIKLGRRYEPDKSLPKAFWLDADGTFFGMGERDPFDFHLVHLDYVHEHILNICNALVAAGYKAIVMTGRDESCREGTWNAFVNAGLTPHEMYMRPNGTNDIQDFQIKEDMFFGNDLHKKYFVEFALDDRNSVVQHTRDSMGIPVLQVAPGDF
jgi:predicted kinase